MRLPGRSAAWSLVFACAAVYALTQGHYGSLFSLLLRVT